MDFKERFKDKTSRITKDGPFANENVVKGFSTHSTMKTTSTNGMATKLQSNIPQRQPTETNTQNIIEPSKQQVIEYKRELKENKVNPFYIQNPYEEAIQNDIPSRRENSYLTPQSHLTNKQDDNRSGRVQTFSSRPQSNIISNAGNFSLQKEEYIQHQREINGVINGDRTDKGDVRMWENPAYRSGSERLSERQSSTSNSNTNNNNNNAQSSNSTSYTKGYSKSGGQTRDTSVKGYSDMVEKSEKKMDAEGKEFKPYTLKEYKDIMDLNKIQYKGLGPNTNTEQYKSERMKNERRSEFAQQVKIMNAMKLAETSKKPPLKDHQKLPSKREKALNFAKTVPKPKQRTEYDEEEDFDFKAKNELEAYEQQYHDLKSKMEKMKL